MGGATDSRERGDGGGDGFEDFGGVLKARTNVAAVLEGGGGEAIEVPDAVTAGGGGGGLGSPPHER